MLSVESFWFVFLNAFGVAPKASFGLLMNFARPGVHRSQSRDQPYQKHNACFMLPFAKPLHEASW